MAARLTLSDPSDLKSLVARYRDELARVRRERDQALEALGETERQLAQTQLRANIGTWIKDLQTDRIIWSDEVYRIFGFEPGAVEVTSPFVLRAIHEDDRLRIIESIRRARAGSMGANLSYRIRRPDGSVRHLVSESILLAESSEAPQELVGTVQDVTDLVVGTNISVDAYRPIVDQLPIYMIVADSNGVIRFANQLLRTIMPSVRIDIPLVSVAGAASGKLTNCLAEVSSTHRTGRFDFDYRTENGRSFVFEALVSPILTAGEFDGYIVCVVDHTTRESTRAELIKRRQALADAQRVAGIGSWEWDVRDDIVRWSDQTFSLFGLERRGNLTFQSYLDLVHPDDLVSVTRRIRGCVRSRKPFATEHRFMLPDGTVRTAISKGEPILVEGELQRLVGTIEDITARKRKENRLIKSELKYRALLDEVKRAHNRLLTMSQRLSSISDEERRRISIELHDEVGGLLTALQLRMGMFVAEDTKNLETHEYLKNLVDSLIEKVRDITRKLQPSTLDRLGLTATLETLFNQFEELYSLELDVSINMPDEDTLPGRIQIAVYRIVREALVNVVRHAGVREAVVSVSQTDDHLRIHISDEGKGFPVDLRVDEGSIGLSGMRNRVHFLNGTIDIGSAPDGGTRIQVDIPV